MTAAKKYWETHDYDTFECKYIHPDKEAFYQAREAEERERQPMKAFKRLPPSLQRGEGYVYDITTHVVKNQELYGRKKAEEQRGKRKEAARCNTKRTRRRAERERKTRSRAKNGEPGTAGTPREQKGGATQLRKGAVQQSCSSAVLLQRCSLATLDAEVGPNKRRRSEE